MRVGHDMHFLFGVVEGYIEAPQEIVADQTTHLGVVGYIVFVFEYESRHPSEAVGTDFHFPDGGDAHGGFATQAFCLGNERPTAFLAEYGAVFGIAL
ncbi:MAG: hypothetical protein RLY85_786 [Bacteroidota bacterium]